MRGIVSLIALVVGLFVTIVTLALLRLRVVAALWQTSAVVAWGLISLGVAAGVVTIAQLVCRGLVNTETT